MTTTSAKLERRRAELLARTAQIFDVDTTEAGSYFGLRKTALTLLDHKADGLISQGLLQGELTKIPWAQDAYVIESTKDHYTKSAEASRGYLYFQNASSLLPALALDPKPNETILDMCAAPGGKTIQLAKLTNNQASLTVNDESYTRTAIMKNSLARHAVTIKAYYTQPAQYLAKHLAHESFDKILVDAPCSGEGLINLDQPKTLNFWSSKKIKRLSKLQKMILTQANLLLKPGGTIVYSTCTLAPEENEEVIDFAVTKLKLEPQRINLADTLSNATAGLTYWQGKTYSPCCINCIRIQPNDYMEPFFVCKLIK